MRGDAGPGDCLELPFRSGGGPLEGSWQARAVAWRYFEQKVLEPLEQAAQRPLHILDAGAGVGWLSYRLALRGHRPVAVDLRDDALDGLGAARQYRAHLQQPFPLIQADMQELPLADDQFDLTIFSASFHFAADYRRTLQEARRVMGWGGQVAILDTPVYQHFQQGERIVEERKSRFAATYGTPADSLLSMEYLDEGMLRSLGKDLNLKWTRRQPWPGWRAWFRSMADNGSPRRPVLAGEWIGA